MNKNRKYFSCFFKLPLTHLPFLVFPCSLTPCNLVLRFQCFFYWDTSLGFRFLSVQSLSHVQLFVTPWTAACQASLSFTISWSLLQFMSVVFGDANLTIPSSVTQFFSYLQSFPASGSFPMSWLFASSGQILELQPQDQSLQ